MPGGKHTTVEGYDDRALYDQWQDTINSKAMARAERNGTDFETEHARIMERYKDAAYRAKARRRG